MAAVADKKKSTVKNVGEPTRLYVKGVVQGFKRGMKVQYENVSLVKIQGVEDKKAAEYYFGKRVAYIYTAKTKGTTGSKFRCIWGKVARAHGTNGVVRVRFSSNLPASSFGGAVRVMLYPSRV
jgi:large subunit ribosomal protein L35Ae